MLFGLGTTWLEVMIQDTILIVAAAIPFIITFLVLRALRPGVLRALIGLVLGAVNGALIYTVIRILVGAEFANGPTLIFTFLGAMTGWMAGIGAMSPYSHEHEGFEHMEQKPSALGIAARAIMKRIPDVIAILRPLIKPLLVAVGVIVVVLAIFMVFGSLAPSSLRRVQTDVPSASAVTVSGNINLPGDISVNKTVFFVGLVVFVIVNLGILALILSLIMNFLSREVNTVKKAPNEPLKEEPPLFRIVDFFVTWVNEIMDGARRSVQR